MTAIAGVVDPAGWVAIAFDSSSVDGAGYVHPSTKGVRLQLAGGEFAMVASSGRSALAPLIRWGVKVDATPDPTNDGDCDAWAQAIAEAITDVAREKRMIDKDDDALDGAAMFAWRHRLWHLSSDLAVPIRRFHAEGSGEGVIRGALEILTDGDLVEPQPADVTAIRAVEVACRHHAGCTAPARVLTTRAATGSPWTPSSRRSRRRAGHTR